MCFKGVDFKCEVVYFSVGDVFCVDFFEVYCVFYVVFGFDE